MSKIIATFFDADGKPLNIGDLVRIECREVVFFCHFNVVNGYLIPFDTFAFSRIFKVDKLPAEAVSSKSDPPSDLEQYEYWFLPAAKGGGDLPDEYRMSFVYSVCKGEGKYCKLQIDDEHE